MVTGREPGEGRTGRRLLEGVFVTGVSLLALAVSAYSTYWQRQQARAMVLPRLQLSTWFDQGLVRFELENVGVGPAEIRGAQVLLDGKPVTSWSGLLEAVDAFKGVENRTIHNSTMHSRVLGAGKEIKVFEVVDPTAAARVRAALPRLSVDLCYCSVLDECWRMIDGEHSRHEPVASCQGLPCTFAE
jgi:hypothetical protein